MANAAKAKAAGIAPFMLSNQKKWPAQFMWSAMMVNKHGLDAYQGLIDNKIPWTDPRAVDITAMMKKLADDGMFIENFNSIDFAPAQVPWAQGKALYWYMGSFILAASGATRSTAAPNRSTGSPSRRWAIESRSCPSTTRTR